MPPIPPPPPPPHPPYRTPGPPRGTTLPSLAGRVRRCGRCATASLVHCRRQMACAPAIHLACSEVSPLANLSAAGVVAARVAPVVPQSRGLPQKEGSNGRLSRSRDTRYGTRGPGSRADRNAKTSRHGLLAGDDGASHRRRPSS